MEEKKRVEAVLFSLGKEVSLEKLSGLCSLEPKKTKELLHQLQEDYQQRNHSLTISQRGDNWKLTVRDDFLPLVSNLVERTDLDKALMETLAVIAWKYPVTQSEVIKLRHNKAYEHIKRLMELEFVEKERTGRTYKLKLTKKFFEYFDLPSAEAKQAFLKQVPPQTLQQAEQTEKEAEEVEVLIEKDKKETATKQEIGAAIGKIKAEDKKDEKVVKEKEEIEDSNKETDDLENEQEKNSETATEDEEDLEEDQETADDESEEELEIEGEELEEDGQLEEEEDQDEEDELGQIKPKKKQKQQISQVFQ